MLYLVAKMAAAEMVCVHNCCTRKIWTCTLIAAFALFAQATWILVVWVK